MSLFRKPKKPIQRRVFSGYSDEEENIENGNDRIEKMEVDGCDQPESRQSRDRRKDKDKKTLSKDKVQPQSTVGKAPLLSFDDEEEGGEVFQVKKSSYSKKVMKQLDKERRKKKIKDGPSSSTASSSSSALGLSSTESKNNGDRREDYGQYSSIGGSGSNSESSRRGHNDNHFNNLQETDTNNKFSKRNKSENSNSIQTEIRTADFVLVVKKSEQPNIILNGRAAICAGKDDLSSGNEEEDEAPRGSNKSSGKSSQHKFSHPNNFKMVLESGVIPDAAMIHAARKRRQKAREQGDFIPVEEEKPAKKGNRLVRDDADDGSDEEERVDMSAITGVKEREERREKFYSAQQEYNSGEESDPDMNEWENQQIRKGVTGVQLASAQQESSVYSHFIMQPLNAITSGMDEANLTTGALLEQAYAKSSFERPRQVLLATQHQENKPTGPRMPSEVLQKLSDRLVQLREINKNNYLDMDRLTEELMQLKTESEDCDEKAPAAANKYRFYQEMRGYVTDLIECLDEKIPVIGELEKKAVGLISKRTSLLVERRRQDVRDQAREVADSLKSSGIRKGPDDDHHTRRAAEREGRRTRRRRDREKNETNELHLDGMSSDDEVADHDTAQYKQQIEQITDEATLVFEDASEEYSQIEDILRKFEAWKKFDSNSYNEAYVTLCLPKIIGPLIRLQMTTWSPFEETFVDIEKMYWFNTTMLYGYVPGETESSLAIDADVRFVPAIVEKIILPKITEHIESCWDPLSTTQTFKLVGLIGRLSRDYPSLRALSKTLQALFTVILDKMKLSLENDVFIPIFPKHMQEAKTSFFQRQFCSGLKLFRNFISWQGILSDSALKELAISSLLNRYLLSAMRVCTPSDAISKAYIIVNTLPRIWLQPDTGILESMQLFIAFLKNLICQLDKNYPSFTELVDKTSNILSRLHCTL